MSYSEDVTERFYHFSEEEEKVIEDFLEERKLRFSQNSVCGSCCGMYADNYFIPGIGREKDFPEKDKKDLYELLKSKGISCSLGGYTLSADPNEEDEYQVE